MRLFLGLFVSLALIGCDEEGEGVTQPVDDPSAEDEADTVVDADGDGFDADRDCDDNNAAIFPGAQERCDGVDNNCDTLVDDEDSAVIDAADWYLDSDADTFGDIRDTVRACAAPTGYVADNTDCDDSRDDVYPGGPEVCDEIDNDCDELVDDDDEDRFNAPAWYTDNDEDGYGETASVVVACVGPEGTVPLGGDCDDEDPTFNPDAVEDDCTDPNDYNCDGSTGFQDADGDGYPACTECDDFNRDINPEGTEICNRVDDDCDGDIDIDDDDLIGAITIYVDDDEDGYGDEDDAGTLSCAVSSGYVLDNTDCDDRSALSYPRTAFDFDDDNDNDCDGSIDEDVGSETYSHDDIQSIWNDDCSTCHTTGSSGGLSLSNAYSKTVGVASSDIRSMDQITPGDPDNSYIWLKIENTHRAAGGSGNKMPPSGSVSASDRAIIETWILEGAIE
ncbi:MAG: putative metal-binding motif-containing protein [Myxococcota bacterium]